MDDMTVAESTSAQKQIAVPKKKDKVKSDSTNFIQDVAVEVENLPKLKALGMAEKLAAEIEVNYLRLGGVLDLILRNKWYEGIDEHGEPYGKFSDYVREKFGFEERKALYLIDIYNYLVTKGIPWATVHPIGWTKLKDLARAGVLTAENAEEWVEKCSKLTVAELQLVLKGNAEGTEVELDDDGKPKVTEQMVKFSMKLHPDQSQTITQAINKAKGELPTKYDAVALESICLGFLSDQTSVVKVDLVDALNAAGVDAAVEALNTAFPTMYFALDATGNAGQAQPETEAVAG